MSCAELRHGEGLDCDVREGLEGNNRQGWRE